MFMTYGVKAVIKAAKIQCVAVPRDCPFALTLFGKISEINTQITVPWPIAWDAIKIKIMLKEHMSSENK